jgi:hypothetical protein
MMAARLPVAPTLKTRTCHGGATGEQEEDHPVGTRGVEGVPGRGVCQGLPRTAGWSTPVVGSSGNRVARGAHTPVVAQAGCGASTRLGDRGSHRGILRAEPCGCRAAHPPRLCRVPVGRPDV